MNAREAAEHLLRYLRREQRELPMMNPDLEDPLPEVLAAMNATLQRMAVTAPRFAVTRGLGVLFHGPTGVPVTGLVREGREVLCEDWPVWAEGCAVRLPGEGAVNRLLAVRGESGRLLSPFLGEVASGEAVLLGDCAVLDGEVLEVLPPVRVRGGGLLRAVNGPGAVLRERVREREAGLRGDDFGRWRAGGGVPLSAGGDGQGYFVDGALPADGGMPRLRLRLVRPVRGETVVEFEARCRPRAVTANDVFNGGALPVPGEFVESVFLPLALMRFFGSSVMRNTDAPGFVEGQAKEAEMLLAGLRPQGERRLRLHPGV